MPLVTLRVDPDEPDVVEVDPQLRQRVVEPDQTDLDGRASSLVVGVEAPGGGGANAVVTRVARRELELGRSLRVGRPTWWASIRSPRPLSATLAERMRKFSSDGSKAIPRRAPNRCTAGMEVVPTLAPTSTNVRPRITSRPSMRSSRATASVMTSRS